MSPLPDFTYEGNEPYIFASYSHQDHETVLPLLRRMQAQGFRIWFDAGIEHGDAWQSRIVHRLESCRCFLVFLSSASIRSRHCFREIHFAAEENKAILAVHLDDSPLPSELRFLLGPLQAIFRRDHENDSHLLAALCKEPLLQPCLDPEAAAAEEVKQHDPFIFAVGGLIEAQESRPSIMDTQRMAQFQEACRILQKVADDTGALMTYTPHGPYQSMGYISLCGADLIFEGPAELAKAAALASNVEIYPKTDGTVQMDFTFHGLTRPIQ